MSGARQCYVVGAYVPPNDRPSVRRVEKGLRAAPEELELILVGDLNMRLGNPHDEREEDLVTALSDRGLVIMIDHFLPRRRYQGTGS